MSDSGRKEEFEGRAKKAAGEITGDEKLKREGQIDKAEGKTKEAVDKTADALKHKSREAD